MVSINIETIGPRLKGIKVGQLEPELLAGVLELAQEHGYEITITAESDLQFLYHIYKAEQARDKKDAKRLKKAENLILTLSGIYSLHHEGQRELPRQEAKRQFRHGMMEETFLLGTRIRELFESIGITDEKDMLSSVELLGEGKIEERVGAIIRASLGDGLIKGLFGEHPETLRITGDSDFEGEIRAIEDKKRLLDAWMKANGAPPIWADYSESPSVLLVDYRVLCKELGINQSPIEGVESPRGTMDKEGLKDFIKGLGYELKSEEGMLLFEKNGRVLTLSDAETYDPATIAGLLDDTADEQADDEMTKPAIPSAINTPRKHPDVDWLSMLNEMGIDVSRLSTELDSISKDPDTKTRTKDQARFDSSLAFLHDLIAHKNLEGILNADLGTSGLYISKVGYLVGATGVFELQLSEKNSPVRRVYLSAQDMEPAVIGKEVAEASGLAAYEIWTRAQDGKRLASGNRMFAVSEDARDVGRRGSVRIRMPGSQSIEELKPAGAAIFKEDLVLRPDPLDGFHADFYRSLADKAGRKEILISLMSYLEISRRALLPDRRPVNTYILRVRGGDRTAFTFQPMDLDGVGNFIGSKRGKPDFSDYDKDFHKAAVDFAIQIHEGMMRAARSGVITAANVPSIGRIFSEMAEIAVDHLPGYSTELNDQRNAVLKKHDGEPIGIGFDATKFVGHTIPSQGSQAEIIGKDGRVRLDAERAMEVMAEAGAPEAQSRFIQGFVSSGADLIAELPVKVAKIAVSLAEAGGLQESNPSEKAAKDEKLRRLRKRTGGELASRIASASETIDLLSAEREAAKLIFGA